MRDDISKLSNVYIEQIATLFDGEFMAIDQMIFNIGLDKEIVSIMNMDDNKTANNRYMIRNVVSDLDLFSRANRLIESIDLYASKSALLIGESSAYYDNMMDIFSMKKYGISSKKLDSLLQNLHSQKVIRLKNWHGESIANNSLIYIQSLPVQANKPTGAFIISIDESRIKKFAEKELYKDGKVLIFSEDHELIYTNDPQLYSESLDINAIIEENLREIHLGKSTYIKEMVTTNYKNWIYVSLVPKDIYFDRANRTRDIVFIITFLFLILNIFMAYFFTNRMYMPLKKIITAFNSQEKFLEQSEYDYIERVISKTIEEHGKMRFDLHRQQLSLKNSFFAKVFKGQITDNIYFEQQLENFDIYIGEEGFTLLLIHFIQGKKNDEKPTLSQFIIRNVYEEILSSYVTCQIIEIDGMLACLINNDSQGILMDEIEAHLHKAIELTYESFDLDCVIGISRSHMFLDGIPNAYQESIEAINHARMLGQKHIIRYEEIQTFSRKYEFSVDFEYQLIHFIKIGDISQAISVINEVFFLNSRKQVPKFSYWQCLMFDVMGAIIKSIDNESFDSMLDKKDPINLLLKAMSIQEMKDIIIDVIRSAGELNATNNSSSNKSSIQTQINSYIEANYSNPDLNVSKLGVIFNMTPAYLSKLYKQETGNTILYALNKARIDASKQLLEESNLSINEISEKVGYLYSNAFIRFFKNQTGLTPGQYKSLRSK